MCFKVRCQRIFYVQIIRNAESKINERVRNGMKRLKRMISGILAILMLTAAAGCQGSETASSSGSGEASGGTASESSNFNAEGWPVVNEKVTLKVYGSRDPNALMDYNEYILIQEMEETTNVHIEWELVEDTTYSERRSVRLTSNDLPEVVMNGLSVSEIIRYGTGGTFRPLEELQEQYCPQLMAAYQQVPTMEAVCTMPDGHVYTFPMYGNSPWGGIMRIGAINTDWLEAVDMDMPTDLNEFKEVLIAFRDQDPNGNGQKDEIPLGFAGALYSTFNGWDYGLNFLGDSFRAPANTDLLDLRDGKVTFVAATEEYKNFVRWMHELYEEDLIDDTGFSQSVDQFKGKLTAEEPVYGVVGVCEIGDDMADMTAYDHWDYLDPMDGPNGEEVLPYCTVGGASGGNPGYWAITSACKQPEVACRVADYFYDEMISLELAEGRFGDEVSEEEQVRQIPCTVCNDGVAHMIGDPPEGINTQTFRLKTCPGSNHLPGFYTIEGVKKYQHLHYTDKKAAKIEELAKICDTERIGILNYTTEEAEIVNGAQTELITFANRRAAEWVLNGKIDEEWDAYLEELEARNLSGMLNAMQAAQDRFEETMG